MTDTDTDTDDVRLHRCDPPVCAEHGYTLDAWDCDGDEGIGVCPDCGECWHYHDTEEDCDGTVWPSLGTRDAVVELTLNTLLGSGDCDHVRPWWRAQRRTVASGWFNDCDGGATP